MADNNDTIQGIDDILASFENINETVETKFTSKSESGDNDVSSNLNKAKQWIQNTAYDITNNINSIGTTIKNATSAVYDYVSTVVNDIKSDAAENKAAQSDQTKLFGNNMLTDALTWLDSVSNQGRKRVADIGEIL